MDAIPARRRHTTTLALLAFLFAFPTLAAPPPAPVPAPEFPSGCEPDLVRSILASADSADVARACGNMRMPWGYRSWVGRLQSMRSYGRRAADGAWTGRLVKSLLDSATVDTIYRVPASVVSCKPSEAPPIYLVRVHRGKMATSLLLRFDLGVATIFADESPLGMIVMGPRADSVWALLGQALEDDPAFRHPRPEPRDSLLATPQVTGEALVVDTPPELLGRGRELPPYPPAARKQGIQGTVHVLVRVDALGRVEDAVVHSGPAELRDSALETVWGMRFKPARTAGLPAIGWTMVPMDFQIGK